MINKISHSRYIVAWVVAIAMFMETLDVTIIAVAIPTMALSFHVSPLALKLALTSYLLSLAIFIPISGWIADKWGTKRVFIVAMLIFTVGSLACALSQSLGALVAARLLQGLGGAMLLPVGRIVVYKTFDKSELIRATNHMTIPALIGPALGPLVGGFIVHYVSWRWIFIINLPIGLIGTMLAQRLMINYHEKQVPPLDWVGFILLGAGLITFSLSLEFLSNSNTFAGLVMSFLVISVLLFVIYGLWSSKQENPVLGLHLLKIKSYAKGLIGSLLSRVTISCVPFLLPLLFQVGFGWSPLISGILVSVQALGMIGGKFIVSHSLNKFGFKNSLIINSLVITLIVISFSFISYQTSYLMIVCQILIFGASASIQFTTVNLLCYSGVSQKDTSKSASLYSIIIQYSGNIGISVTAISVAYFAGASAQSMHLPVLALSHSFLVMSVFIFLADMLFLSLKASDGAGIS